MKCVVIVDVAHVQSVKKSQKMCEFSSVVNSGECQHTRKESVVKNGKITVCNSLFQDYKFARGTGANYMWEFPFLAKHSMIAGPSMIRPLRQSVVMGNTSAAQDVQCFIRVLHVNQPLALENVNIQHVPEEPGKARVSYPKASRDSILAFINQHPRTRKITNSGMRTGVSIPILPGDMSQYKEYHQWENIMPSEAAYANASALVFWSSEQEAAYLLNRCANLTPMSTLIISVPTMNSHNVMSFNMVYHYQDSVRAADPESISAQFARPGRPMPSSLFNNLIGAATRSDSGDVDVAIPVAPGDDEVPMPDAHMFTPLVQERPQESVLNRRSVIEVVLMEILKGHLEALQCLRFTKRLIGQPHEAIFVATSGGTYGSEPHTTYWCEGASG